MSKIEFKKDFLWGGASAAEQAEGRGDTGKSDTVWDEYFRNHPDHFYQGVGPSVTSDFFHKYKDDIKLFKSFNVNSLRLGISWARLIPDGKNISAKGLEFYHNLVDEVKKSGMKMILNMFHFDMPLWAQNLGGWESNEVIDKYLEYVEVVYKEFADKVDFIATMNEPIVPVIGGYVHKFHWPLVKDYKRAFQAGFGTILAHAKAVNLFNDKYRSTAKAKIGVVINVNPPIAGTGINPSPEDVKAAKMLDMLHNDSMLLPMTKGYFPKGLKEFLVEHNLLPKYAKEDIEAIKRVKIDFLGANYYSPSRVVAPKQQSDDLIKSLWEPFHYDKARYNVFRGWEIRPETIYDLAMKIKNEIKIPFYISENGMGVEGEEQFRDSKTGEIQDHYRIAFLQEHLSELNRAMKDGADCFGYHMWAITDNWSWRNAYKNRYGFVEINIKDQSRKLKASAHWFGETIKNNGFDSDFKKIEETIDLVNAKYTESVNGE